VSLKSATFYTWIRTTRVWKNLDELYAGICDGMTYEQIAETYPEVRGLVVGGMVVVGESNGSVGGMVAADAYKMVVLMSYYPAEMMHRLRCATDCDATDCDCYTRCWCRSSRGARQTNWPTATRGGSHTWM
jgi:hypothetical protein